MKTRRNFLTSCILLVSWVIGCSRKGIIVKDNAFDWKLKIADEIRYQHQDTKIQFDPTLVMLLAGYLLQLIGSCLLQKLLTQHKAVNRHPDGRVDNAMRVKLKDGFIKQHPDCELDAVTSHVDSSMHAFREASDVEIAKMYHDQINKAKEQPTDADWNNAAVAKEIMELN